MSVCQQRGIRKFKSLWNNKEQVRANNNSGKNYDTYNIKDIFSFLKNNVIYVRQKNL